MFTKKTLNSKGFTTVEATALLVVLATIIAVGALVYSRTQKDESSPKATPHEIEAAKLEISELYSDRMVEHCPHPDLPEFENNISGYVISYRYLRINSLANRAIISSCGQFDTLLAKNSAGEWVETNVNITINNRVNPSWQKACLIEDITVADEIIRPENSSIDETNLEECNRLMTI